MTIGERIKAYRKEKGLSQEQMAEALNVSRQAITKWESGKGLPDIENLIVLSRTFGVSLDEMVGEEASFQEKIGDQKRKRINALTIAMFVFWAAALVKIVLGSIGIGQGTGSHEILMDFVQAGVLVLIGFFCRYLKQ